MSVSIKVCGVTEPENVRKLARLHPDYFGIIFVESSPRFVARMDVVREINSSCGDGKLVAVVKDPDIQLLTTICSLDIFFAFQIHGNRFRESAEYLKFRFRSIQVWQAVSVDETASINEKIDYGNADKVVFDGSSPGSGIPFDWKALSRQKIEIPFLIAGGIGVENSHAVVEMFKGNEYFEGLDVNSRVESSPGVKDCNLVEGVMVAVGRKV